MGVKLMVLNLLVVMVRSMDLMEAMAVNHLCQLDLIANCHICLVKVEAM